MTHSASRHALVKSANTVLYDCELHEAEASHFTRESSLKWRFRIMVLRLLIYIVEFKS